MNSAEDDLPPVSAENRQDVVKARARVYAVETLWRWFWGTMIIVVIGFLFFNAIQGVQTRQEILSCTTPSGECYQEGQERTKNVVRELYEQGIDREQITRQIIVLAASCAGDERNRTAEAIERCVNDRLATENRVHIPEEGR